MRMKAAIVLSALEIEPFENSAIVSLTSNPQAPRMRTDFVYAIEVF